MIATRDHEPASRVRARGADAPSSVLAGWSQRLCRPVVPAAAAAAVVRLAVTVGEPIGSYWDSPGYFRFALWGGERSPVVTGLYTLLDSPRAIVTVQALIGAACWSAAASLLAWAMPAGRRRVVCVALVGLLGATQPVASWDNALLSESLSLSTGVLAVALLVRATFAPTRRRWGSVLGVSAVWMLCRPNNASIGLFLLAALSAVSVVAIVRGRDPLIGRRMLAAFGAVAVVGMAWSLSDTGLRTFNAVQVIEHRVFGTPEEQWFIARGMPADGQAIAATAAEASRGVSAAVVLLEDPDFGTWARREASASYSRFVARHPGWVLDNAFGDRSAYLGLVSGSVYSESRDLVPAPIDELVWPTGRPTFAAALAAVGVAAAVGPLRGRGRPMQRRRLALAGAVLTAVAMDAVFVIHTAGDEYPRLLLVPACLARLVLLWLVLDGAPVNPGARLRRVRRATGGERAADVSRERPEPADCAQASGRSAGDAPGVLRRISAKRSAIIGVRSSWVMTQKRSCRTASTTRPATSSAVSPVGPVNDALMPSRHASASAVRASGAMAAGRLRSASMMLVSVALGHSTDTPIGAPPNESSRRSVSEIDTTATLPAA